MSSEGLVKDASLAWERDWGRGGSKLKITTHNIRIVNDFQNFSYCWTDGVSWLNFPQWQIGAILMICCFQPRESRIESFPYFEVGYHYQFMWENLENNAIWEPREGICHLLLQHCHLLLQYMYSQISIWYLALPVWRRTTSAAGCKLLLASAYYCYWGVLISIAPR